MMNMVQGDCKCGALAFVAGEDLSAATGLLVKLSATGKVVKPGAVADITPYVVACGAFEGYLCGVVPLSSAANCRVALMGTCQPGSLLVAAGDGRVEKAAVPGEALLIGIAEETGVEGQRVLLRPVSAGARGAAGAAGTPGAAGPAGAAGVSDGIGYIGSWLVLGSFWGSGQVLFFGPDNDGVERWASAPGSLMYVRLMGLVTEVMDPTAADVVYRFKLLAVAGVNSRTVSVPLQYVANAGGGLAPWGWIDAGPDEAHEGTYLLLHGEWHGYCGGVGLHVATTAGDEVICVSEVSA